MSLETGSARVIERITMHICMVMAGDEEGGLEKHVVELANGLAQAGQKVTLIAHEKYAERVSGVEFKALDLSKSRKTRFCCGSCIRPLKPRMLMSCMCKPTKPYP